jgi:hypothetical protein
MAKYMGSSPVLFLLFVLVGTSLYGQEELPFWRQKPALYDKVLKQRKVLVSVKPLKLPKGRAARVVGVGVVNAPVGFVRTQVGQFQNLAQVSSYFKKVVHKPENNQLYIHVRAMGYETRLLMSYKWTQPEQGHQLDWQVTEGTFQGMQGHYLLREVGPGRTEVSTWMRVSPPKTPVPDFLFNFTLEVIAEKVAHKMRSYIEEQYRK